METLRGFAVWRRDMGADLFFGEKNFRTRNSNDFRIFGSSFRFRLVSFKVQKVQKVAGKRGYLIIGIIPL